MRELLFGGIIYLTGVSIILITKPELFFNKEGRWKEFGIGRSPETHTWFPLWLFCIFWAIISYSLVYLLIRYVEPRNSSSGSELITTNTMTNNGNLPPPITRPRRAQHRGLRRRLTPAEDYGDMRPGVYVIDEAASARKGIPHYIYYGKNSP